MNKFSYILNPNPYLSYRPKEIQANECLCKVVVHRPSKCQKIYTNRILWEQNLRQKVNKFCQNLNHDNIMYLIKYALTVEFSI